MDFFCGALCRTRTGMNLRSRDFKSLVSTIPPRGHIVVNREGFEPSTERLKVVCSTN